MRRHGQTHGQYIRTLEAKIQKLEAQLLDARKINGELVDHRQVVSLFEHQTLKNSYNYLVERLVSYGLWTGE